MISPTTKGQYTKEDLEKYALYRKNSAVKTIQTVLKDTQVSGGEISAEEHEEYQEPLALSKETVVDVQLSTGGDGDGFKLTFDQNNEIVHGVYYWVDWFVYEEVSLSDSELELVDTLYTVGDWLRGY